MNDMSAVIVAKSDQINADDLISGPRIVTIAGVKINPGTEQPVQMALEGTDKLFRPCKTVSRVIVALWGADASQYAGRSLRLFRDPNVTWGGVKVGGIRIDQASHIDSEKTLVVKESQKASKTHKIKPLKVEAPAQATRQTAEQWAEAHIEAVRATTDVEALATLQSAGKKAVDKIAAADADLHRRITDAYGEQLEKFDNPAAAEKRDDTDMGEDPFGGDE
jgi:regulator of protease activity HflC (stomatin/prohibitin superfamily)